MRIINRLWSWCLTVAIGTSILTAADPAQNGIQALQDGRERDAITAFEQALAINDERGDVWANLALAHLRAGNPSQAMEAARSAVAKAPKDPGARHTLARVQQANGDYAAAARDYMAAAQHAAYQSDLIPAAHCILLSPVATPGDRDRIESALRDAFPNPNAETRDLLLRLALASAQRERIAELLPKVTASESNQRVIADAHAFLGVTAESPEDRQRHLALWEPHAEALLDHATTGEARLYGDAFAALADQHEDDSDQRQANLDQAATAWAQAASAGDRDALQSYLASESRRSAHHAYQAGRRALEWGGWGHPVGWKLLVGNYGASGAWSQPIHLVAWLIILSLALLGAFHRKRRPKPVSERSAAREPQARPRSKNGSDDRHLKPGSIDPKTAPLERRRPGVAGPGKASSGSRPRQQQPDTDRTHLPQSLPPKPRGKVGTNPALGRRGRRR